MADHDALVLGLHVEERVLCLNSNFFDSEWLFHLQHVRIAKVFEKLKLKDSRGRRDRRGTKGKRGGRGKRGRRGRRGGKTAIDNQQNEIIQKMLANRHKKVVFIQEIERT